MSALQPRMTQDQRSALTKDKARARRIRSDPRRRLRRLPHRRRRESRRRVARRTAASLPDEGRSRARRRRIRQRARNAQNRREPRALLRRRRTDRARSSQTASTTTSPVRSTSAIDVVKSGSQNAALRRDIADSSRTVSRLRRARLAREAGRTRLVGVRRAGHHRSVHQPRARLCDPQMDPPRYRSVQTSDATLGRHRLRELRDAEPAPRAIRFEITDRLRGACPEGGHVDFELPSENDPRRRAVRAWCEANPNPTGMELARAGYVVPHWPRPWGLEAPNRNCS